MIPSLVDATPRTLSGLRPWEWLRERLEDQDPDGIPKLMEVVVREAANELQPLTLGIEKQIRGADREGELKECEGELAEEALRAALMVGTIKAFAADPIRGKAFAIKSFAWRPVPLPQYDPYGSINNGAFLVDGSVYPAGSLDRLLANAPLFVVEKQVNGWFNLLPPSTASLRRAAETLIASHQRDQPNQRMRRQDFLDTMKKDYPLASGRQLQALWRETAPEKWKRPGTKVASGRSGRIGSVIDPHSLVLRFSYWPICLR